MQSEEFAWAVEEACHNAWPAPREALLGRWLLRAAGGPSRRINSLNPLRGATPDVLPMAEAERIMAPLGLPLRVRVPALVQGLGAALGRLGFAEVGGTCTLAGALDHGHQAGAGEGRVLLSATPSEGWFALRRLLLNGAAEADAASRAVVASLLLPRVFATLEVGNDVAAVGLGVLSGGIVIMEAIGTAPAYRGRGFAHRLVASLMHWGGREGATHAALQVVADNMVARRLYARLGFDAELYRYSYFERPITSSR